MKYRTQKIGRNASTGRFMSPAIAASKRSKHLAVVETVRIPVRKRRR